MMTPTHEIYRVLLRPDHFESLWTLRLFDDDTLQVEMENTGDSVTGQALTMAPVARDVDQYVNISYIASACVLKRHTPAPGSHTCQFTVQQRDDGMWSYVFIDALACVISSTHGFQWYVDLGAGANLSHLDVIVKGLDRALRHPVDWSVVVEPVRATLYPLSGGVYTLVGSLMSMEHGLQSPIILHLELLPDSQVVGACVVSGTDNAVNRATVSGSWTRYSLELSQDVDVYLQSFFITRLRRRGRVTRYAIQAQWTYNDEPYREEDDDELFADLRVTSMRRR